MLNISSQSKVAKLSKKFKRGRGGNQSDEVESLAAATKSALSGSEPSDSIQVTPASFLNGTFKLTCQTTNSAGEVKISTKCDNFDNIQNNCCYCGGPSHLRTNELLTNTAVNSR